MTSDETQSGHSIARPARKRTASARRPAGPSAARAALVRTSAASAAGGGTGDAAGDAALPAAPTLAPTDAAAGPILERLRRAEGQVRGVQRMIEARQDCEAVLTQLLAARAALDRVAGQVVAAHLEECLAGRSPADARATIQRAVQLLSRAG